MTHKTTKGSTEALEQRMRRSLSADDCDYVFGLDSIAQQALAAAAGRAAGAAVRNAEQGRAFRAKVAKAAALASLYDVPKHKRVDAVRDVFLRLGPDHFGLAATPDDKTIRAVIKEIIGD